MLKCTFFLLDELKILSVFSTLRYFILNTVVQVLEFKI